MTAVVPKLKEKVLMHVGYFLLVTHLLQNSWVAKSRIIYKARPYCVVIWGFSGIP